MNGVGDVNDPHQTPFHTAICTTNVVLSIVFNLFNLINCHNNIRTCYQYRTVLTIQLIIKPKSLTVTVMFVVGSVVEMFCEDHITTSPQRFYYSSSSPESQHPS